MAEPFTNNNGTTFYNQNFCRSFNLAISASLQALVNEVCSEVIIVNKTGKTVIIYDSGYNAARNGFLLEDKESFVLRGITNAMQVSAIGSGNGGNLYYRTQWYSNLPQR
jgi:hypothetical protein